ncbi:MAG TPA: DNA polymerase III subunit epsilon [Caulobacteraceae bacterium]|nr:DNA polymerase III subunit epsilon [Caulobacteraceae bacterium]
MTREIVIDTETTGLDPREGHRLVELAAVEIEDFAPSGRSFHRYVNPQRPIDREAQKVHGLTAEFLAGKPTFSEPDVADALLAFVGDAQLVAHNAAFDRAFIEHELARAGRPAPTADRWIDSLELAQRRFPGMYNSLDALCKRFRISLAQRGKHGALIDAQLLARVYIELKGGRERALDLDALGESVTRPAAVLQNHGARPRALPPRLTPAEAAAHAALIRELGPAALWLRTA